jgi:hypothetical protein
MFTASYRTTAYAIGNPTAPCPAGAPALDPKSTSSVAAQWWGENELSDFEGGTQLASLQGPASSRAAFPLGGEGAQGNRARKQLGIIRSSVRPA